AGRRVDQLTLQDQVARSGPLDPQQGPGGEIWGDPSMGFVGRANGGGPAGGFGVYQGPIADLARRHGVALRDLSHKSPKDIYRTLLSGRPVMVWVALSEGPYASWHSPAGKIVNVNYGEHAVVLSGVTGGDVTVNDPLSGQRLRWSKGQFESMWASLGHRALAA
ncbi:MAG TPA: C39 family peptidase, partial [Solirubrobacterales bacterium]|nr:C39 family peptidase [Solirubrobacterales bacterium]